MTLLLVIWGSWSAIRLPIDAVPDITNNQVQIYTSCPTLAGQEVEQLVTFPIEQSIANVPGVEEIRSISRFGLSVITVVFEEKVDVYFARQQIHERLMEAEERIPAGIGRPELAPVSTGLGEVYQYIIHPQKGSEHKYSASDLRTMQDWIVARQLNGTPGIAEINSFGGELKQYEVAVNPNRLKAMGVSIPEIVAALEANNQNTGGAYIDKKPQAYFIRGVGLATSLEDVRNIAVKKTGSIPVLIRDVAEVRFGSAVRYGALTYDGEVDAVGGVVMMLKGENSHEVVERIKAKLPTIQQSLPEDIVIEPYLDRTDLVGRAIGTVEKNLIEGALIVIFVLVLFLGNFRAGLIVASAIPLSMAFALGMMNVFGVSANLMSLGAIDFGLIVDGAVIIVEATLHHLGTRIGTHRLTQDEIDEEVYRSASRIRTSAAFGEIIILIVYIPILTLAGIEGKMFAPMAMTVGFAILGALILSMTYIPMMCALFLPKERLLATSFSEKWMARLQQFYRPLLLKAIKHHYLLIVGAAGALVFSILSIRGMGGEFIPQLQEGDYAFHCFLPAGSSLSQSIETSMQASRILKSFDEVKMVVGKTGAAEVPTDPMPPEATDLMVILKSQNEWPEGKTYQSLADEMMEKLSVLPGVYFEKNQPIQMRFNELMTGIRQDVAIKIFGENMDTLAYYAERVASVVRTINGATEPQVERVHGLPQINVEYDRIRLANYGLTVEEVNDVLSTAFAGKKAGVIFENERRFDLVVRLDSTERRSIDDVENLMIPAAGGLQIPLYQVARVDFRVGPAQISREGGKRRIVIGFNVAERDVESVVDDIRSNLSAQVKLPSGYYFDYGGQFENLKKAKDRLQLAVPLSLLLIYLLLYLTFHSFKQATLIFTSIPMAAIGGVFALLLRGMPFSISAGIGFIALFGVSVLNAIVLIGTFNQLEKEGVENPLERVTRGTSMRLRPVLMTAAVASLGFLPMAMSTSAGAEVQKPLATVVIGGLLSSTFLTLFILPLLYLLVSGTRWIKSLNGRVTGVLLLLLWGGVSSLQAQKRLTVEEAVEIALKDNQQFLINHAAIKASEHEVKTARELPKTGLFAENEDMRPSDHGGILKVGVSQSIAWPGLYTARKNYYNELLTQSQLNTRVIHARIRRDVESVYYQLWYLQDRLELMGRLDSIYTSLFESATVKQKAGENTKLDWMAAEIKMKELRVLKERDSLDMLVQQRQLMVLLNKEEWMLPEANSIRKFPLMPVSEQVSHPILDLQMQRVQVASSGVAVEKKMNLPEFSGRFFSQRLWGATDPFSGFSVTAVVPIFSQGAYRSRVKAAEARKEQAEHELVLQRQLFEAARENSLIEFRKADQMIRFYEASGLEQSDEIIRAASIGYRSGQLSFADMMQFLSQAIAIRQNYLEAMNTYNQAAIQLNYYNNR